MVYVKARAPPPEVQTQKFAAWTPGSKSTSGDVGPREALDVDGHVEDEKPTFGEKSQLNSCKTPKKRIKCIEQVLIFVPPHKHACKVCKSRTQKPKPP